MTRKLKFGGLAAFGAFLALAVVVAGDPHSPEGIRDRCRSEHPSNINGSFDRCVLARLYVDAAARQREAEAN